MRTKKLDKCLNCELKVLIIEHPNNNIYGCYKVNNYKTRKKSK